MGKDPNKGCWVEVHEVEHDYEQIQTDDVEIQVGCVTCGNTYHASKISGPTTVNRFEKYLTGAWAKAKKYRWSSSATTTLSIKVKFFSFPTCTPESILTSVLS
ncbi:hypothetical protein GCM10010965_15710 [Caldalkalibacillus thermarum]|nr:hypothetical protein GCM10010965_15710 [Caldalkalibacillus thermarum]